MDNIHRITQEIHKEKHDLLDEQLRLIQASRRNVLLLFSSGIFLAVSIIVLVYLQIYREIVKRQRTQEVMERQLAAVEAAIDGIAILDPDSQYIYLNQAHLTNFGYDNAEELIGKTWKELYSPEEIARFEHDVFPILGQKRYWRGEATGKKKDGSTVAEEVSLTLLEDGNLICICRDISERKQIEKELREQKLALEYAVEGIARLDAQGRYIAVNNAYASTVGYTPEEMLGMEWQSTVHPKDITDLIAAYQQMLAYGKGEAEARGLRKDGSVFYKQVTIVSAWDDRHNFIGHYCFMKNISDRKQLEAELHHREERFRILVNHSPVGIFQTDSQGNCLFVNPKWTALTGLSITEALGTGWVSALHPDDRDRVSIEWYDSVLCDREFFAEYRLITPADDISWVFGRAVAIHDASGAITGYFGTVTDITERKLAEEQLKTSLKEKEVLLKEVHHRVKNNLQVIDSLFRHQCRQTKEAQLVLILKECQNRVGSMALLHEKLYQSKDLAKIELADYIQSIVSNLLYSYSFNGNTPEIKFDIEPVFLELETALSCGLIVNELISNCLKYAFSSVNNGKIKISLFIYEKTDFRLIVKDNGIGFPADFDLENSKTLGLKIVKSLTRQLGGSLELNSQKGTEFIITFKGKEESCSLTN
jgi:PAS domain S-box-containing protein